MHETHIILRRPSGEEPTRGTSFSVPTRGGPSTSKSVPSGATLAVDALDKKDMAELTRDPDVMAVAPSVPMRLIEPVGEDTAAEPAEEGIAWGVQAVGADTSPFTGAGIVVAVLDTGIDPAHSAFAGVELVQKDFTGEGNEDVSGHGTHCAGTLFGRATDGLRIGVAPGVKKALIGKVIGTRAGSSDQVASAVWWAVENGAHVISLSLGIDFPGLQKRLQDQGFPPQLATSRALEGYRANVRLFQTLADMVQARGAFLQTTLLIAAAGNESKRDVRADFEIAVGPPAVADGFISVAAVGPGEQGFVVAPFSNTGAQLSGPGVAITSARRGGGLVAKSGTSMATPHVAGVCALWAEKIKRSGLLSQLQLKTRLLGAATPASLQAGFDPMDVGLGLARAPQE